MRRTDTGGFAQGDCNYARKTAFTIDAWVLLPDNFQCIWTLPVDNGDLAIPWSLIKQQVSELPKGHKSRIQRFIVMLGMGFMLWIGEMALMSWLRGNEMFARVGTKSRAHPTESG